MWEKKEQERKDKFSELTLSEFSKKLFRVGRRALSRVALPFQVNVSWQSFQFQLQIPNEQFYGD